MHHYDFHGFEGVNDIVRELQVLQLQKREKFLNKSRPVKRCNDILAHGFKGSDVSGR